MAMELSLYDFFVNTLFGSFWMSVIGLALVIFVILAVLGRLSKLTIIFYVCLFLMVMTLGFGMKFLTTLIGIGILIFVYLEYKNATSN